MEGQGQKHRIEHKRDSKTVLVKSDCFQHLSDQIILPPNHSQSSFFQCRAEIYKL